jgi:ABC-type uncharacterized transport system permease subunit
MNTLPNILKNVGKFWIKAAIAIIILSYGLNLIISDQPFVERFLAFINIWNVLVAILLILPGFLLTELSDKLDKRNREGKTT